MNHYTRLQDEDRRLGILLLLSESTDYRTNQFLLQDALDRVYGHNVSLDRVRADLAWLEEQGLLETQEAGEILLAVISSRGLDVALGRARHPGVKRPRPS